MNAVLRARRAAPSREFLHVHRNARRPVRTEYVGFWKPPLVERAGERPARQHPRAFAPRRGLYRAIASGVIAAIFLGSFSFSAPPSRRLPRTPPFEGRRTNLHSSPSRRQPPPRPAGRRLSSAPSTPTTTSTVSSKCETVSRVPPRKSPGSPRGGRATGWRPSRARREGRANLRRRRMGRHDGGDVGEERRPAEGRPAAADEFVLPVAMFVVGVKRRIFRV